MPFTVVAANFSEARVTKFAHAWRGTSANETTHESLSVSTVVGANEINPHGLTMEFPSSTTPSMNAGGAEPKPA